MTQAEKHRAIARARRLLADASIRAAAFESDPAEAARHLSVVRALTAAPGVVNRE